MKVGILAVLFALLISGCASVSIPGDKVCNSSLMECIEEPQFIELPTYKKLRNLPPAEVMPVVAVYKFDDLTGQRVSSDGVASFSTAVTQGAKDLLIEFD